MHNLQGTTILVIDDEPDLLELANSALSQHGAQVYTAANGEQGLRQFFSHQPDVVILDLMMPKMDGWKVCRRIRQLADTPIIMLTALSADGNVIRGLDCGADDFIGKPFSFEVLRARICALLRRTAKLPTNEKSTNYNDGYLTIEPGNQRVFVRDQPIKLTPTELRLLIFLFQNANRVLSCEQILDNIWGEAYRDNPDYVHVYVRHLRKKLEEDPAQPIYVLTEHGLGYRFEKQVT